jgi:hypothetical protein
VARELAAWRVLLRSRRGELGPVIGACTVCGMPATGAPESGTAAVSWTVHTPRGDLAVGSAIIGPDGALSDEEADRFVTEQLAEPPPTWRRRIVEAAVISPFVVLIAIPVFAWVFGLFFALFFIQGALPLYRPF